MKKLLLVLLALFSGFSVHGYELGTHARLTQQAYLQSVLSTDASLFQELGIDEPGASKPFGENYLDISGGRIEERKGSGFSETNNRMPKGVKPFSIKGWFMRGAIREDDYLVNFGAENPQDDAYGPFNRPLHHFYDPINDKGLSAFPVFGTAAPDWAIGSSDSFANPALPNTFRRNHFTLFDARESLFRALTGKDKNWTTVAANKTQRDKYWATVFRALGDVVHLVQDMGQPQHTRNDRHSGKKYDGFAPFRGHKSVFEAYVEARAKQDRFIVTQLQTSGGTPLDVPTEGLKYTGYPVPAFDDYASYFSSWHIDGSDPLQRRGLADYSNRGFFTAGTNFGDTGNYLHPDPDPKSSAYIRSFITTDWSGGRLPNGGAVKVLRGTVPDKLTGSQDQAVLSTVGLWDQFLVQEVSKEQYTLTRANYDDMADLLIPRAVAYSAGMISHFFRGRMEILIDQYSGQSVTLKFVNRAKTDTFYHQDGLNELSVVYTYNNANGKVFGTSEAAVSLASDDDIPPDSTSAQSYTFTFAPPIPSDAKDLKLQLVYRGKLGNEEDAVAIGSIEMSSPGFIFNPSSVPVDGIEGSRYIYRESGQWVLSSQQGLTFGNIDWKGWYVDGKPTKVLSWQGPRSRYFPNGGGFTPNVYNDGDLFSVAPYPVLGAALNKDTTGGNWLIVICQNGNNDIVLRRPFTKDTSAALYDAILHPEGWTVLGEFTPQSGFYSPDRPWFFNGSGTEAQTMRKSDVPLSGGLERLKIQVTDTSAAIEYMGNHLGKHSFGDQYGNGCVNRYEGDFQCSGTAQNPTGSGTSDGIRDDRFTSNSGWTGSYIAAVDYIDDQETLATLSLNDALNEVRYFTEDQHNEYICYLISGVDRYDSASSDRKSDSRFIQVKTRTLSLSSRKINNLIINQLDFSRSSGWPDGKQQCDMHKIGGLAICDSETHQVRAVNSKETLRRVDFMDLRNGVALASTHTIDEVYLSHQDAVNQVWSETTPVILRDDKTTTLGYEFRFGGETNVLYSNSVTTPGVTITPLPAGVSTWNLSTLCTRQSSGEGTTFSSLTANVDVPLNVPIGNIATDASGDVFASIRYQDAGGALKVFNFLTNGDPSQITGISDPNASFYSVGLK